MPVHRADHLLRHIVRRLRHSCRWKDCNTCGLLRRRHHAQRLVAVFYGLRPRLRRHELGAVPRRSRKSGRLCCGRDCICRIIAGAEVSRHLRAAAAVVALDAAGAQCQSMSTIDNLSAVMWWLRVL